jgi:hypothetical protein
LGKTTGRIKELLLCCKRYSRPLGVAAPPLVGGLLLYFMNPTHEGKVKQSVVFFSSLCPLSASCSTSSIQLLMGTQLTTEFSPMIQVAKLGCICRVESLIFGMRLSCLSFMSLGFHYIYDAFESFLVKYIPYKLHKCYADFDDFTLY